MKEVTRERLEEIVSDPMINQGGEFAMMARMALAALDSEPVAWTSETALSDVACEETSMIGQEGVVGSIPLYRHAQQPVAPDAYVRDEHGRMMLNDVCEPKIGFGAGWNACRAAMLNK